MTNGKPKPSTDEAYAARLLKELDKDACVFVRSLNPERPYLVMRIYLLSNVGIGDLLEKLRRKRRVSDAGLASEEFVGNTLVFIAHVHFDTPELKESVYVKANARPKGNKRCRN